MVNRYLNRLYDTVVSRGYIEIEYLVFVVSQSNQHGRIRGRLNFYDGSVLDFGEVILLRNGQIEKSRYGYHYQSSAGNLIFRYDNAPHYPHIMTHPHHKHVGSDVESAEVPDLSDVLREIEQMLFNGD